MFVNCCTVGLVVPSRRASRLTSPFVLSLHPLQSTPLHLAAGYNRVRIVQLLLQHGADVHAKDKGSVPIKLKPH